MSIEDRLKAVLEYAAVLTRPCRRCGEMLYIVRNGRRNGESPGYIPFTIDGRNHVTNCPHGKNRAAQQEALFDAAPMPD